MPLCAYLQAANKKYLTNHDVWGILLWRDSNKVIVL